MRVSVLRRELRAYIDKTGGRDSSEEKNEERRERRKYEERERNIEGS